MYRISAVCRGVRRVCSIRKKLRRRAITYFFPHSLLLQHSMVRITEANFDKEYERIKQDSVEGNCIIFVASDVDAICACKIFQVRTSMHLVPPRDPLAHCIYYSLC